MKRYVRIYSVIEKFRNEIVKGIIKHRTTIEHYSFKMDKYEIEENGEFILVYRPFLEGRNFIHVLSNYYEISINQSHTNRG